MRPGLIAYDDHTLIFVCGNNVVVQSMVTKEGRCQVASQKYISGIEGTQGITTLALSPCKRYLAVCEKAKQAVCAIYDPLTQKRKKILTSNEYQASEFVAAAFSNTRAMDLLTHYLITVTGEPDFSVKLWLFDKQRYIAQYNCPRNCVPSMVSFHPDDNNSFLVTGRETYLFLRVIDTFQIKGGSSAFYKPDNSGAPLHYTSHLWIAGRLVVTTQTGEILIGEQSGEFKFVLPESPGERFPIRKIVRSRDKNFIIADDSGRFKLYQYTGDPKTPWVLKRDLPLGVDSDEQEQWAEHLKTLAGAPYFPTTGMLLFNDALVYTTENRQLMRLKLNEEKPREYGKVSFLTVPFHSQPITAIATCLKRPIVVTASKDKTIRVWSYHSSSSLIALEICETMYDEVSAMALHPSGNYLLASFSNAVQFLNIYPRKLEKYHELPITACVEIKFTTQGHLVAIQNQSEVHVYRFFTAELPANYTFGWHLSSVKSITWNEDDTGFVTAGIDNSIAVWQLPKLQGAAENIKNEPVWTFKKTLARFLSTIAIKMETAEKTKEGKATLKQVVFASVSYNNRFFIYEIH